MNPELTKTSQLPESLTDFSNEERKRITDRISTLLWKNQWDFLDSKNVENFLESWFFGIFLTIVLNSDKYEHKNYNKLEKEFSWKSELHIWNPDKDENLEKDFYDIIEKYFIKQVEDIFDYWSEEKKFINKLNETLADKMMSPINTFNTQIWNIIIKDFSLENIKKTNCEFWKYSNDSYKVYQYKNWIINKNILALIGMYSEILSKNDENEKKDYIKLVLDTINLIDNELFEHLEKEISEKFSEVIPHTSWFDERRLITHYTELEELEENKKLYIPKAKIFLNKLNWYINSSNINKK